MKRDPDLLRSILLQIEAHPAGKPMQQITVGDSCDGPTIAEHIELLIEGQMIVGEVFATEPLCFAISRLTGRGHDFLSASRDDSLWAKAKKTILKPTASWTLELLQEWLKAEAKKLAGLGDASD